MLEVLRLLQAGPFTVATLTEVQVMLSGAAKGRFGQLGGVDLTEVLALLEGFSDAAESPSIAAQAQCMMARLHLDASDTDRAVECYAVALECDPLCRTAVQSLVNLLKGSRGASRLAALLAARAQSLRSLPHIDDDVLALAYRSLAEVKVDQLADADGAIVAYNQAVDFDPDIDTIEVLAGLYASRGRPGDEEQAADLYCAIGEALSGEDAIAYLETALDLMSDHAEAMERLEELVPIEEQFVRLRDRWARYIERAVDDPDADDRRVALSRAYAAQARYRDALMCIAPAADRGMVTAQALREAYVANLEGDVEAGRPTDLERAEVEPSRALRPRSGHTMLGINLSEHMGSALGTAKAAPAPQTPRPSSPADPSKLTTPGLAPAPTVPTVVGLGPVPLAAGAVSVATASAASLRPLVTTLPAATKQQPSNAPVPNTSLTPSSDLSSAPPAAAVLRVWVVRVAAVAGIGIVAAVGLGFALRSSSPTERPPLPGIGATTAHTATARPSRAPGDVRSAPAEAVALRRDASEPRVRILRKAARFRGAKVSQDKFFSQVQTAMPQVLKCYNRALARDATLEGRIVYGIVVGPKGSVASVDRLAGTLADRNLGACGRAVLRAVKYPTPSSKRPARVRLAVRFDS